MYPRRADYLTQTATVPSQVKSTYKRRVIMLKPLDESPPALTEQPPPLSKLRLVRHDSDTSSSSDFSPTSVLPYHKRHNSNLKAGQSQLHTALTASSCSSPAASLRSDISSPAAATAEHQPINIESWTQRHFVHQAKPAITAQNRLPTEPAAWTFTNATAIAVPQKPSAQPAKQVKHGTLEAAWRWRFKRQWRKAQAQAFMKDLNDPADDLADDPWHMAFEMIQAGNAFPDVGAPVPDHDCYSRAAASPSLDTNTDDMDEVFEFEQDSTELAPKAALKPQHALAEAASKARELIKYQAHVERFHQQAPSSGSQDQALLSAFLHPCTGTSQGQASMGTAKNACTHCNKLHMGNLRPAGMHPSISSQMLATGKPHRMACDSYCIPALSKVKC